MMDYRKWRIWAENYYLTRTIKHVIKRVLGKSNGEVFSVEDVAIPKSYNASDVYELEKELSAFSKTQKTRTITYIKKNNLEWRKLYYKPYSIGFDKESYFSGNKGAFWYLSKCGWTDFCVNGKYGQEREFIIESSEKYGIRYHKGSNNEIYSTTWDLLRSIKKDSFDETYLFAIKYLARNYESICVIKDTIFSDEITRDLELIGKQYDEINCFPSVKNDWKELQKYNIVICTSPCMDPAVEKGNDSVIIIPFFLFFSNTLLGTTRYRAWEKDIVKNLIPKWEKGGVKLIIVRDLHDVDNKMNSVLKYNIAPLQMEKYTVDKSHVQGFIGNISPEDLEDSAKMIVRDEFVGFVDYKSKGMNRVGGIRRTPNSKNDKKLKNIFFVGPCIFAGNCSDQDTIENYLQEKVSKYNVINACVPTTWNAIRLHSLHVKKGDVIVCMPENTDLFERDSIKIISLEKAYETDDLSELCWDTVYHVSPAMNKRIAEVIYEELENMIPKILNNEIQDSISIDEKEKKDCVYESRGSRDDLHYERIILKYNKRFCDWYDSIREYSGFEGTTGCIVMNANPYTKGHDYLVAEARKKSDRLIVFVLEEDKSFFSFSDRFNMVNENVKKYDNVIAIPSGRFIISSDTIPGYFFKENLQNEVMDATHDLYLFCEAVAPLLGISVRFVGDEPEDSFTRQYNEQMMEILPENGISLVVMKRLASEEKPITATKVRELFTRRDWSGLEQYVPKETLDYLKTMEIHG